MSITTQGSDFDRNFQPRERTSPLSKIALRRRSSDHPMAMFAILVGVSFVSMAFSSASVSLPTFATGKASPTIVADAITTDKTDRLPKARADDACRGQAWGAESLECLTVIVKESGKSDARKIRVIASIAADTNTPNIF